MSDIETPTKITLRSEVERVVREYRGTCIYSGNPDFREGSNTSFERICNELDEVLKSTAEDDQ